MGDRLEALRNAIDKLIVKENLDKMRKYISHMYGVGRFCTLLAMKRGMDVELATTCGMLHDIHYMTGRSLDEHAEKGAEQAKEILKKMDAYSEDEISIISTAISRHSDKGTVHGPYDELLKDADVMDHCLYNAEFPVAEWEVSRYRNLLAEFGIPSSW